MLTYRPQYAPIQDQSNAALLKYLQSQPFQNMAQGNLTPDQALAFQTAENSIYSGRDRALADISQTTREQASARGLLSSAGAIADEAAQRAQIPLYEGQQLSDLYQNRAQLSQQGLLASGQFLGGLASTYGGLESQFGLLGQQQAFAANQADLQRQYELANQASAYQNQLGLLGAQQGYAQTNMQQEYQNQLGILAKTAGLQYGTDQQGNPLSPLDYAAKSGQVQMDLNRQAEEATYRRAVIEQFGPEGERIAADLGAKRGAAALDDLKYLAAVEKDTTLSDSQKNQITRNILAGLGPESPEIKELVPAGSPLASGAKFETQYGGKKNGLDFKQITTGNLAGTYIAQIGSGEFWGEADSQGNLVGNGRRFKPGPNGQFSLA